MSRTIADRLSDVHDLLDVIAEVSGVLNKLAAFQPEDADGDCVFCQRKAHADDCLWLHARALVKGEDA